MTGRRARGRAVRRFARAGLLAFCGALIAVPAIAFEPPSGNKNFTSPSSVPDYFSNEAAPFGRASHPAQPEGDRFTTAPIGASPDHASMSQPARGGTRHYVTSSRSAHRHAGYARGHSARSHLYVRAAPHYWIATGHRAAASHSRYAAHSARHSRRVFR